MKNLFISCFVFLLLSLQAFAQDATVENSSYSVFGPAEHMQNLDNYQTSKQDEKVYSKAIVFIDDNFSIEEIQRANLAAKELGRHLVVVPKMDWDKRVEQAKIIDKFKKIKEKNELKRQEILKSASVTESDLEDTKSLYAKLSLDQQNTLADLLISDFNQDKEIKMIAREKINIDEALKELKEKKFSIDSVVVSLSNASKDQERIISALNKYNDLPIANSIKSLYANSCSLESPLETKKWIDEIKGISACKELTEDNIYSDIIAQDEKERLEEAKEIIAAIDPNNSSITKPARNPDGSLLEQEPSSNTIIEPEKEKTENEKALICEQAAKDIAKKYQKEFLDAKNQITLYKMAWTTLALSGFNNDKEVKSLETVLNKSIKEFTEKTEKDDNYKEQYKNLLAYESPYKTKWMSDTKNYLPAAMELLSKEMRTDEFLLSTLRDKYSPTGLRDLQVDIKKYGLDYSDVKTAELMHDVYKEDKNGNRFLSNLSTQITSSMRGRGGLKALDEKFYKKEIDKLNKKFVELNQKVLGEVALECGDKDQFSEYMAVRANSCNRKFDQEFKGLLTLKPIIDAMYSESDASPINDFKISKEGYSYTDSDGKEQVIKKQYLKVIPIKPKCNFTYKDSNMPIVSFQDIPKTGEYHIAYIGKSGKTKEKVLEDLKKMKGVSSYKRKNELFSKYLTDNNLFTKQIKTGDVTLKGFSQGTTATVNLEKNNHREANLGDFDQGQKLINLKDKENFIIISSWGNNERQINCKEGPVLKAQNNPDRAAKVVKYEKEEYQKLLDEAKKDKLTLTGASSNPLISSYLDMLNTSNKRSNLKGMLNDGEFVSTNKHKMEQDLYNGHDNGFKINKFHELHPEHGNYITVDKSKGKIYVHDHQGNLMSAMDVEVIADDGDKLASSSSNTIGAGIFKVNHFGSTNIGSSKDLISLNAANGNKTTSALRASETNPDCKNCLKIPQESTGASIYILPEEEENFFLLKSDNIAMTTTNHHTTTNETKLKKVKRLVKVPSPILANYYNTPLTTDLTLNRFYIEPEVYYRDEYVTTKKIEEFPFSDYNYSSSGNDYHENYSEASGTVETIQISGMKVAATSLGLTNLITVLPTAYGIYKNPKALTTKKVNMNISQTAAPSYIKALDEEKSNLMKVLNLSNDDYNELSKLAFGILGQESNFGESPEYKIKEANPTVVYI
ncbi:MAG: hypothetical protein ACI9QD_000543 [Thermoproteota archaeon]|jgi:hypothetical protein